jgi:hypothetical protein
MKKQNTYFMIGIGGIGMSALAIHLIQNGAQVWGYDREESRITKKLAALGVQLLFDSRVEALPEAIKNKTVEVIYTAAIPEEHPQWQYYSGQGNRMLKRAAFLGQLSNQTRSIAIGGTHGKTTTTALLAHLMYTDNTIVHFCSCIPLWVPLPLWMLIIWKFMDRLKGFKKDIEPLLHKCKKNWWWLLICLLLEPPMVLNQQPIIVFKI